MHLHEYRLKYYPRTDIRYNSVEYWYVRFMQKRLTPNSLSDWIRPPPQKKMKSLQHKWHSPDRLCKTLGRVTNTTSPRCGDATIEGSWNKNYVIFIWNFANSGIPPTLISKKYFPIVYWSDRFSVLVVYQKREMKIRQHSC